MNIRDVIRLRVLIDRKYFFALCKMFSLFLYLLLDTVISITNFVYMEKGMVITLRV